MSDLPYTAVTGKLKTLFEKIQQAGKPNLVDKKWLASISFTGKSVASFIPILKYIGFVDSSGKPTDRWMAYRNKSNAGKVLADGILEGYSDLFSVYPDAYRRSDNDLKAYISSKTTGGEQVISKILTTMKTLFGLANFDAAGSVSLPIRSPGNPYDQDESDSDGEMKKGLGKGYIININIQLTLPESKDGDVYDKLFTSMKKHLLS